jgi:DNA-3-methyladenine glycosylase II
MSKAILTKTIKPQGPFDLLHQNQFFNGWPTLAADPKTIVLCFPVEDWSGVAAVTFTQPASDQLTVAVYGTADPAVALSQALACLSLDEDGDGWQSVGNKDPFLKDLQAKYQLMRPSLFHSAYEAAAAFIIGHRITIAQGRKIRQSIAQAYGQPVLVGDETFYAFPTPSALLDITAVQGLNDTKIARLHAVAQAALAGKLSRDHLRSLPEPQALAELETLPGIGPFFSQGILYRGVGIKDGFTQDDMTFHAIKTAYNLPEDASMDTVVAIADQWRPYRMWAIVLLHVWLRETNNFPKRTFSGKR